ncbi:NUDIX domain-containing protein [Alkalihalobacillus pseudalcaliphilus]|uniref:NUDIX domain-containing protein n=1 Tax=Alkalihalobacillus pseudalcaliphilus TaxID=79884 RepID=UPI000840CD18|nr:NUDIX domain-containing protein [Alkalihalobacillus pseudalcaliphilus]
MTYIKEVYTIKREQLEELTRFFHREIYSIHIQDGAQLIGRWVSEEGNKVTVIWKYKDNEHEQRIKAMLEEETLDDFYLKCERERLTSTEPFPSAYHSAKHGMAVSGYITNEKGEVLLVRNVHRSDTMEMPGGVVEEGETLEEAIHREVLEETGVTIRLNGITGIYQNVTRGVTCVVFRGDYQSGDLTPAEDETAEIAFTALTKANIAQWITREQFRSRALDAMNSNYLPYEAFRVRPYELLSRYEVKQEV